MKFSIYLALLLSGTTAFSSPKQVLQKVVYWKSKNQTKPCTANRKNVTLYASTNTLVASPFNTPKDPANTPPYKLSKPQVVYVFLT